jgi:uncharacterized protein YndB with AHSA1/START domain
MTDTIERSVLLDAPLDKVWDALSDHRRFGDWFKVALDQPFAAGQPSTGHITHAGYEHIRWTADIVEVEPPHRFSYRWHPFAIDPDRDYSAEPTTLVEFVLAKEGNGTRLTVNERGFNALPDERRQEAFKSHEGGWSEQMDNIRAYLAKVDTA